MRFPPGRYRLELLLERIPLDSERKANMILSMASERGMSDLVLTTCKVMGMKALREHNRIGTAMAWALRSQVRKRRRNKDGVYL